MGEELQTCPYCGRAFDQTRIQRQNVAGRQVVLVWALCSGCHHVALADWEWEEQVILPLREGVSLHTE